MTATIEQVKLHFETWRKTRTKIPELLWNEAITLYPSYPMAEI